MDVLKHELKLRIGSLAGAALPTLSREVQEGRHTDRGVFLKRLITYSHVHRAAKAQDTEKVQAALSSYWRGEDGNRFHDRHRDTRFRHFLEHHAVICERLRELLGEHPDSFSRLVEIGCGDGQVLFYAAGRLPHLTRCVGVDINRNVVNNIEMPAGTDARVAFEEGDALTWLIESPMNGTILMTYGGVLEYLSPVSVARLFSIVGQRRPAAIAMVEPLDPNHDIAANASSRIFGRENSFSHAYPTLLKGAGFSIAWQDEMTVDGVRWLLVLAQAIDDHCDDPQQ